MEELFLCFFFTGDKLHIVHNKYINVAVFIRKPFFLKSDTFKEFFNECLRADVENISIWILVFNGISNSLNEVSFSKSDTTVKKERIVFCTDIRSDCLTCRVSEVVT